MPASRPRSPAKTPVAAKPAQPSKAQAAFELIKPEMARLDPGSLGKVNTDISQAVSIAPGVLPGLAFLRPEMAKLPGFEIAYLDKLETCWLPPVAWYRLDQSSWLLPEV